MYIFKNDSGIELSVDEFMELIDNDCLPELITIVAHLDCPEIISQIFDLEEVNDSSELERLFNRFIDED